ncbi:tyrosine-type recombinase/integrase [Stieleria varia]|uniref:Tyrosine recombinase XerD n=1 Tax=Stieleria varia TaxID=2528005 RepID=A0A5C6B1L5_9BACT|nr:tyrosine-type recombinase/integrase [Stieleria varia]TWU05780.1 Tyrosine recombinase XerD [Stieleria varia]
MNPSLVSQPSRSSESLPHPIHRYRNGQPYRTARGRQAPRKPVEDLYSALAVIDLRHETPTPARFHRLIQRELKIRGYTAGTVSDYLAAMRSLLRWFGGQPHELDREYVKDYLEYLVDAGHSTSDIAVQLSAIRAIFDKLCFLDITLGLATPRQPRRRVVVLSREEVRRLLQATPSTRDTLLLGLMYATGMRVSEVCRVQKRDFDFDRNQIFIRQGKGRADRHIQLPQCYRALLQSVCSPLAADGYLFPSESASDHRQNRHLSPRTVQRTMQRACRVAGIQKHATPHSLRHAFATHSFEDGCDIRRIQAVLGHVNLETTTIYVKVAKGRTDMPSPLDRLVGQPPATPAPTESVVDKPVGRLTLHSRPDPDPSSNDIQFTLEIIRPGQPVSAPRHFLTGIRAQQSRPGYVTIQLPPIEQWKPELAKLPKAQADRIHEAGFYEMLSARITAHVLSRYPRE